MALQAEIKSSGVKVKSKAGSQVLVRVKAREAVIGAKTAVSPDRPTVAVVAPRNWQGRVIGPRNPIVPGKIVTGPTAMGPDVTGPAVMTAESSVIATPSVLLTVRMKLFNAHWSAVAQMAAVILKVAHCIKPRKTDTIKN